MAINIEKSCIYRIGAISNSTCLLNSHGIKWKNDYLSVLGVDVCDSHLIEENNIEPLINKAQSVINTWKARDLSIVGKALVINSLIMTLFVYRLTILPLLSKQFTSKINKMWSDFLWDGKKPKIAWPIIIAPKSKGGLGLSDIRKRDVALKAQWVTYYLRDLVIASLADWALNNKIGSLIWQCNLHSKDVLRMNIHNDFWSDVLQAWCMFNYREPIGIQQVNDQLIWYNSAIKIAKNVIYFDKFFQKGILYVKDLLHDSQHFVTPTQFKNKYPSLNVLEYVSIIHALPYSWKTILNDQMQQSDENVSSIEQVNWNKSIVRIVYYSLHENSNILDTKRKKWEKLFNIELWYEDFLKIVQRTWQYSKNSKLQAFQYRLVTHAIVTNIHLKLWKVTGSDRCTFCEIGQEDILHLFVPVNMLRQYGDHILRCLQRFIHRVL